MFADEKYREEMQADYSYDSKRYRDLATYKKGKGPECEEREERWVPWHQFCDDTDVRRRLQACA